MIERGQTREVGWVKRRKKVKGNETQVQRERVLGALVDIGEGALVRVVAIGDKEKRPFLVYSPARGYAYVSGPVIIHGRCYAKTECAKRPSWFKRSDECNACQHAEISVPTGYKGYEEEKEESGWAPI